jgi:hypothetical protein
MRSVIVLKELAFYLSQQQTLLKNISGHNLAVVFNLGYTYPGGMRRQLRRYVKFKQFILFHDKH